MMLFFITFMFKYILNLLVDGQWGPWGSWSSCDSKTAKKKRTRKCNSPAPVNGGKQCNGSSTEEVFCLGKDICVFL